MMRRKNDNRVVVMTVMMSWRRTKKSIGKESLFHEILQSFQQKFDKQVDFDIKGHWKDFCVSNRLILDFLGFDVRKLFDNFLFHGNCFLDDLDDLFFDGFNLDFFFVEGSNDWSSRIWMIGVVARVLMRILAIMILFSWRINDKPLVSGHDSIAVWNRETGND